MKNNSHLVALFTLIRYALVAGSEKTDGVRETMKTTGCLRYSIAGMVITGVWLPRQLENSPKKAYYYMYAFCFQFILFFGMIAIEITHLFLELGDIEAMVQTSLLLLTHLTQVAKVLTIWWRQDRIKHLLHLLESDTFNRKEAVKKWILSRTARLALIVSKTLVIASVGTGLMWGVFPMLRPALALPLDYPYTPSGSVTFLCLYVYQTLTIVVNALGDTSEDFLMGCLMVLASAQLDLLSYELTNIGTRQRSFRTTAAAWGQDKDYEEALACVKYHQSIITFVEELDSIFGLPVFCQFVATCIIMCFTAFKITISNEPYEIVKMIFYLVCILAELLVFCYSGNIIMYKSTIVAEAIYCSGWANTSVRTQRLLLLMMLRAQRPLSINAGKIFRLSLTTFAVILKSSYSYFAVLNHASQSNDFK